MMLKIDFDFEAGTVEVRDENEKSRRGAVLPLRQSTAGEIKQFLKSKTPQATAFTMKKGYLMMKTDLKAAGIEYKVDGKFADFHSLRHSTASLLIQTGANPKMIQTLMRHSDLNLTMQRYTHLYAGQQRETIESLPDFVVQQDVSAMTGTYDCVGENRAKNNCPKTAHQGSRKLSKVDNSYDGRTSRNMGLDGKNSRETAFIHGKNAPAFSGQKIGATGLEPATSCTPCKRASQTAPRPVRGENTQSR